MNQLKKAKVNRFSVDKESLEKNDIIFTFNTLDIVQDFIPNSLIKYFKEGKSKVQHLYFTVDNSLQKPIKGDYIIRENYQKPILMGDSLCIDTDRKIIATTDPKLNLSRPSDSFIKKYCKLGGIDEVLIEYEELYFHGSGYYKAEQLTPEEQKRYSFMKEYKLKVAPDNTITIKPIKSSWSREEILFLRDIWEDSQTYENRNYGKIEFQTFDKWLEENL